MNHIQPPPSHLFYQSRQRRPLVGEARGIYLWDAGGRRYLDGSSGAMVANIGHGNERVLAAMRAQMDKATFAYRRHPFRRQPRQPLRRLVLEMQPVGEGGLAPAPSSTGRRRRHPPRLHHAAG